MSWKEKYIRKYGEGVYAKRLVKAQEWRRENPEKSKEYYNNISEEQRKIHNRHQREQHAQDPEVRCKRSRDWRKENPRKATKYDHDKSRKNGKHYKMALEYKKTGLQGERSRIRAKDRVKWRQYKNIIAPESQLHHQWISNTAAYRGVALVETDQHRHGIIDVIQILEGEITLFTEGGEL